MGEGTNEPDGRAAQNGRRPSPAGRTMRKRKKKEKEREERGQCGLVPLAGWPRSWGTEEGKRRKSRGQISGESQGGMGRFGAATSAKARSAAGKQKLRAKWRGSGKWELCRGNEAAHGKMGGIFVLISLYFISLHFTSLVPNSSVAPAQPHFLRRRIFPPR
jgi:hypothetical protein